MLFIILNIVLIGILCFSSVLLAKHRIKANNSPVSGENQVDKLYDLYYTKRYKFLRLSNIILGVSTIVLAAIELLMFYYYRFLNYNEGLDFMKKLFMDFFVETGNILRDDNIFIPMFITMLILLAAFLFNFFAILKVRKAFYVRVRQFMKDNVPSMYDHVPFKPMYVPQERELVLCQDRFNRFRFDQNNHSFHRWYRGLKVMTEE